MQNDFLSENIFKRKRMFTGGMDPTFLGVGSRGFAGHVAAPVPGSSPGPESRRLPGYQLKRNSRYLSEIIKQVLNRNTESLVWE